VDFVRGDDSGENIRSPLQGVAPFLSITQGFALGYLGSPFQG
jgi:hypothetical protein